MAELGSRGQAFYDSLVTAIEKHHEATKPLLLEAARIVERLDDIDDVIAGKDVLSLLRFRLMDDEGEVAEVKFDAVMSEARQQQVALAGLMKTILPNLNADAGKAKGRDPLDEIAERRAARRAAGPAGSGRSKRQG